MSDLTSNYPDILGHFTHGERCNIGVVQMALAVYPFVVRAGHPFQAVLLMQNASDAEVDVTLTLRLPERDAKRQKDRFSAQRTRLVVGLRPAEVGYVALPLVCHPDTAVSEDYKLEVGASVNALQKPHRVRTDKGIPFTPDETLWEKCEPLKKLRFSTARRSLQDVIEAQFSVLPGKPSNTLTFKPGWVSLWAAGDHLEEKHLLKNTRTDLKQILPQLVRQNVFKPLYDATLEQFAAAGYPLKPAEALFITKLLTRVLELATIRDDAYAYAPILNVSLTLETNEGVNSESAMLPEWCRGLLRLIDSHPQAAAQAPRAIAKLLYPNLVTDAMPLAFGLIAQESGETLGTDAEVRLYTEKVVRMLKTRAGMDFDHAYLPLVIAGIVICERVIDTTEKLSESLRSLTHTLSERRSEQNADNDVIFDLAQKMIDRAMEQFDYMV